MMSTLSRQIPLLTGALLLLTVTEAAAQSSGGTLQPVQSTLTTLVQALTGPIATALATLAVIACGFFAWSGRLTWGIAGSVIFGIVLVFGSAQIVQFFQSAVGS
jgi:type IV secretion system protein VirB2